MMLGTRLVGDCGRMVSEVKLKTLYHIDVTCRVCFKELDR